MRFVVCWMVAICCCDFGAAQDAARGKKLLETKSYVPPAWRTTAYDNLWQHWNVPAKPTDYEAAVRERYGFAPAPYANQGLPMGLKKASFLFVDGISIDCMACHGGSILGTSYIGLGNAALDLQAFFEEMSFGKNEVGKLAFQFSNVRGTTEAGAMSVYLLGLRNPDLSLRRPKIDLEVKDDMCEDVPAWWLLKKKKTMYYTGGADAKSVRSKMQFMMSPITTPNEFHKAEPDFRDIQAYMLSLEAPKNPNPIDTTKAAIGEKLFATNCASCHGTYGSTPTYPNKIIPIDSIGTDRKRFEGISDTFGAYYNRSWFAQENKGWFVNGSIASFAVGYQAPPLDGIWATAPYFHNGSVPTLYHVLNSEARPKRYTRSFHTDAEAYDALRIGWKYEACGELNPRLPASEHRKVYDTSLPGRGNGGHTYGDHLTDAERFAVIEYLKTL